MKRVVSIWLILVVSCWSHICIAQSNLGVFDTIPISKPKRMKQYYQINHPEIKQIKIKSTLETIKTKPITFNAIFTDLLSAFVTELSRGFIEASTTTKVYIELSNKIDCYNPTLNWNVSLFLSGDYEDISEDDEYELPASYSTYYNREEGARGLIIENNDTIAHFFIEMNLVDNPIIYQEYGEVFNDPLIPLKTASESKLYKKRLNWPYLDFAVFGKLRGENFTLIANGKTNKMWFYLNKKLTFIFKPDIDDKGIYKEDRVLPYLFVETQTPKDYLPDLFRMAIFSKYISLKFSSIM